tara:strand:- start:141 stop:1160 length:1020 start_codon:yes stop_codon:yes gene_type:complete
MRRVLQGVMLLGRLASRGRLLAATPRLGAPRLSICSLHTPPSSLAARALTKNRVVVGAAAAATAAAATAAVSVVQCESSDPLSVQRLMREMKTLSLQASSFMDKDGDGKLTTKELEDMFNSLGKEKNGQITFDEWHELLHKSGMSEEHCSQLEELFRQLDRDGSGTINIDDFRKGFHADYAARYARGAVVAFLTKGRFIAYTSDIGESARPVMPAWFVNGAYGLTFLYVSVAVGHHTYEAHRAGASDSMVKRAFAHTATFEVIASVALPSLIIHQVVHFVQHYAHRLPKGPAVRWAPTVAGLCCIPFLPFLDPPAEKAIDAAFDYAWPDDGTMPEKAHH